MNDNNEQQHLLKLVDDLIAGDAAGSSGQPGKELTPEHRELLEVAARLRSGNPEPSARFETQLTERLAALGTAEGTPEELRSAGGPVPVTAGGRKRRLFPSWLTLPRAAAVAAALVVSLGMIGLTAAIIRGPVQQGASDVPVTQSERPELSSPIEGAAGDARAPEAPDAAIGSASGESTATGDAITTLPSLEKVIQTADYDIEVDGGQFQEKYDSVVAIAGRYGGYVVSADSRAGNGNGQPQSGTITVRVSNSGDGFSKAMHELDGLGEVKSRKISGEDVSEEYIDLQSRLRNAESRETSLLALMQKAQTIDEILQVQSRLDEVQAEIEQLKGRIAYMDARTDFATITVRLHEQGQEGQAVDTGSGYDWGFVDALGYGGWLAVQTVNFIIMALAVILPVALALSLAVFGIYRLILWRTGSHPGDN